MRRRSTMAVGLTGACLTAFCLAETVVSQERSGEGRRGDLVARIEKVMHTYVEYGQFSGTVLVADSGKVIYRKSFGLANREWGIPNTPDTRYRIASLGKAFTATVILRLTERDLLDLNTPISAYLPEYRTDNADRVTLHHLLTHTAGVRGVPDDWLETQYRNPYTLDDLVELANQYELEFDPGTRSSYSNNGYNLMGAITERVTGKSFEEVLHEEILDPLGMQNTGLVKHQPIVQGRASSYNRLFWGEYVNAPYQDESFAVAAGGMLSTVDDMFKWDRALYGNELLTEDSKELMFKSHFEGAGYGWSIGQYKNSDGILNKLVLGAGGTRGAASVIYRLTGDQHLVLLLGNIREIPQFQAASNITNILVGLRENPQHPPAQNDLYNRIFSDEADATLEDYLRLRKEELLIGRLGESDINRMGYQLLLFGRSDDAVAVLQFNVSAHPDSWNVYDSYAEALAAAGRTEEAIDNYRQSLKLNPDNGNAERMLDNLNAE